MALSVKFKYLSTLLILLLSACTDETLVKGQPDSEYTTTIRDSEVRDSEPDQYIHQWDARPPQEEDMAVDAEPPIICARAGIREPCTIPGLLGPCGEGFRICQITEWSQCTPQHFPRIEVCDHLDNDCDGNMNESPPESQLEILSQECYDGPPITLKAGLCHAGVSMCEQLRQDGPIEEQYGYGTCSEQTLPTENELCDGLDNDCDRSIDEGVLNACGDCGETPAETCDTIDNDCDGLIDEAVLNACGVCGVVPDELCDFLDNDCDGLIDENMGDCICDNPLYVPQPEICNGLDEDCDNRIDEGDDGGPLTRLCTTDIMTGEVLAYDRREDGPEYVGGVCRLGITFCDSTPDPENPGSSLYGYFECLEEIQPRVERCNGLDEDCDGLSDEGFQQGEVAVMIVIDVSGSMHEDEIEAAFTATTTTVEALHARGANSVCYMLAIVGNDEMDDPYLYAPAHNCVPGVEDPPVAPIEDMRTAALSLMNDLRRGAVNQGGSSENTYDAIGKFFTDDLIDWDGDGILDDVEWSTSVGPHRLDLSAYTHRIVVVLGDERGQGDDFDQHTAAMAMGRVSGMVYIIGPEQRFNGSVIASYQQLIDIGALYVSMGNQRLRRADDQQEIANAIQEAIEEADCINGQQP